MQGSQGVKLGWKAYSQGDLGLAESEFQKAASEGSKIAYPTLQQGLFYLRQDRFQAAAQSFEAAASKEPKNPAPLFFLALAHELADAGQQADETIARLTETCPRHQGLTSLSLLRELRRGDPLPVLTLLGFGDKTESKRWSKETWRSLAAGLGVGDPAWLPPDLSSSAYVMGPILLEVERRLLGREIPKLEHRPTSLIDSLEDRKPPKRRLADEIRAIRQSWKGGPKLRKGRQLLERAMSTESQEQQRRELNKASAWLRLGKRLDPYAFRTSYHLGEAYLFSAKGPPGKPYLRFPLQRAEGYFLHSARTDGINPYVLFYLALISQLLGRPQAALDGYLKATEKFAKLPEAHYGMGQCHLLLGQPKLARELLLKAVDSDLALARERLNLFANLLRDEGNEALRRPLPKLPADPTPVETLSTPLAETSPAAPDSAL